MSSSATERARRHARREEAKVEAARDLTRALADTSTTQTQVAAVCGLAPSKPQRWADPDAGETMTVADLALLLTDETTRALALELLSSLAERAACVIVAAPAVASPSEGLALVAKAARESADVIAALVESHADGQLTPDEGSRLAVEGRELAVVGHTVAALGQRVVRERGLWLRAVGT